jgi:hypothetical protein
MVNKDMVSDIKHHASKAKAKAKEYQTAVGQ